MARDGIPLVQLQAGKAVPRGAGRGVGKAGPSGREPCIAGDGGNGAGLGDATSFTDGASGAELPGQKIGNAATQSVDAAGGSAGAGGGAKSTSQHASCDAALRSGSPRVSGTAVLCTTALNSPAGFAAAARLDASACGDQPAAAHAVQTKPEETQRQGRTLSETALTTVHAIRQVIPAAWRCTAVAPGGSCSQTPSRLARSGTGYAEAAHAGAVPVWSQPDGEPQSASSGQQSTVPVSTAVVRATPASKAVIVHKPLVQAGAPQPPPPQQQQLGGIANGLKGCSAKADAALHDPPCAGSIPGFTNGNVSEQPDSSSPEVGTDGSAASQMGGAHEDGSDDGWAHGECEKCVELPYTWSQARHSPLLLQFVIPRLQLCRLALASRRHCIQCLQRPPAHDPHRVASMCRTYRLQW